ncbi:MAG TPA: SGNH/GDSL hydrolase family protein [Agriterribacter sp.]|nr:SGNH/GDSL hydrolase family protein [Agriterribacter sp.]
MKRTSLITILTLLLFVSVAISQPPVFQNGDRIAFIGSSIAQKGGNFHNINLFLATRYPNRKITFLNAGIGGDFSNDIIDRMDADILSTRPTWAVMMLEENDLQPGLYYKSRQEEAGIAEKKQYWIDNWFRNADSIIRILKNANIKVILETPTIYDQTGDLPAENGYGVNDALQKCAAHLRQLAEKYDLPLVDCWSILKEVNEVVQKKDPTKSIIGPDRVHVSPMGYFVMAYQFLKTIPVSNMVSNTVIDARKNKLLLQENCSVSELQSSRNQLSFTYKSNALPFPAPDGVNVDSFFSFSSEMNAETFRIKGLKRGNYSLSIDRQIVGSFSAKELERGVNLSLIKSTPQYMQSLKVLSLFEEYWNIESAIRRLKSLEYSYIKRFKNKETMADLKNSFDEILEQNKQNKNYNSLKNVFASYMTNKPKEKEMLLQSESLYQSIYENCAPIARHYVIARLPD